MILLLTHFLAQNRKFPCGSNGGKSAKDHSTPGNKGLKRAINRPMEPPDAAHNPEVAGSSPASATNNANRFRYRRKKSRNLGGYWIFLSLFLK